MRIGLGFDVHRFDDEPGEFEIMLGGVSIPHNHRVLDHSDGDVIMHALMAALFGALALGNMGKRFPDSDPAFRNVDSRELLRSVYSKIIAEGYRLGNVDITVIAEAPRVADYVDDMRRVLSAELDVEMAQVSIKATTNEKMGSLGRREGIAAQAIVLVLAVD